jgi:L-ascorbate metabolism protein UlaG (beta-lactamase superfamily)
MSAHYIAILNRMIITYHGGQFVKIAQGDTVIAVNPFGKDSNYKPIRFGARIGLVSVNHPDYNGAENLSHGEKVPFIVRGPGEYEIGGITISGFLAPKPFGANGLINTIYTIEIEGIRLCLLGALSSPELSPELFEGIGSIDILFVPIGGGDLLSPADAEKIAVSMDAKMVIPLAYDTDEKQLAVFKKEAGADGILPIDKLTLKKKDLEGKEGEVVILEVINHA